MGFVIERRLLQDLSAEVLASNRTPFENITHESGRWKATMGTEKEIDWLKTRANT
jgi:hypothetical protein